MSRDRLALDVLPSWLDINNVQSHGVGVKAIPGRGRGLIAASGYKPTPATEGKALVIIPRDLVLSAEAVDEYAKEDGNFKQLVGAAGRKSPRGDILLFLLAQLVLGSRSRHPWGQYLQMLDDDVPVPTLWHESQRQLLDGTSLERALIAKTMALRREFDAVRDSSLSLPYWDEVFWEHDTVAFTDWLLVDAWYRSRCLELPGIGSAMVPYLDMANHSSQANAFYELNYDGDVVLRVRPDHSLSEGDEVLISYGDEKSAAEMLFSYGFIDNRSKNTSSMTLPLQPMSDDPLLQAKVTVFSSPPTIMMRRDADHATWESPFATVMVTNQEDGLHFMISEEVDGEAHLRMFWQDQDITDQAKDFDLLIDQSPLSDVLRLRAAVIVQQQLEEQRQQLVEPLANYTAEQMRERQMRQSALENARLLRESEKDLLEAVLTTLEKQTSELMTKDSVQAYLTAMNEPEDEAAAVNAEDNEFA